MGDNPPAITGEKVEPQYDLAPFFGWTEEKQYLVDTYDPAVARAKLESISKEWNDRYRRILNNHFVESGERKALCDRYTVLGMDCPSEHLLNVKLRDLLLRYAAEPDPWLYAEIVYTFNVIRRRASAYEEEKMERVKPPVEFNVAPVAKSLAHKPFQWNDFSLLDGNNWTTFGIGITGTYEYNPTVVAVGGADTLVFAFEAYDCSYWCPTSTNNSCIIVGHSYNGGQSMTPDICIYNTARNLGEPAVGADPYRKIILVAYSYPSFWGDYDIDVYVAHISDLLGGFFRSVATSFRDELTPYVNVEFNWGEPGCQGQWTSSCACSALDNWYFIGYNRNIDPYVERSQDCGNSWSIVYNDIPSDGSAYASSQIMLETSNDPSSSSSVCSASDGGDNTIQGVFVESDDTDDHEIWHIYTDRSGGWGTIWTSTILINNYPYPINQPWMSIARTLDAPSMTHLILFESQYSSTDGDIMALHTTGLPPGTWDSYALDYTTVDSRTPTVHSDARWQWCPGATTLTADHFHAAFYHKCPSTYDGTFCNETPSAYNNTYRVVVMRAPWESPEEWGPEYCTIDRTYADTVAIPPPPVFANGGIWQNWWQINGTTYRANTTSGAEWWFGALWLYEYSSSDWDVEWSVLTCLIGPGDDDELATDERSDVATLEVLPEPGRLILRGNGSVSIYTAQGRLVRRLKVDGRTEVPLPSGAYFVSTSEGTRKVLVR